MEQNPRPQALIMLTLPSSDRAFIRPIRRSLLWAGCLLFPITMGASFAALGSWFEGLCLIAGGLAIGVWTEIWCSRRRQEVISLWEQLENSQLASAAGCQNSLKPSAAVVHCNGVFSIPSDDPGFFEPIIFTPERMNWGQLKASVIILLILLIPYFPFLPLPYLSSFIGGLYVLWWFPAAALIWYLDQVFRTDYVRLAPGMVQFITFGWRTEKMKVRSYPIAKDTTIVITGDGLGRAGRVTLQSGASEDHIPLAKMRDRDAAGKAIWSSILSTAPTPPLSADSLVG